MRLLQNIWDALQRPPEFILHDSTLRLQMLAAAVMWGSPLQAFIFGMILQRPSDSFVPRAASMLLSLPLLFSLFHKAFSRSALNYYWLLFCFVSLPFTCVYLYRVSSFSDAYMGVCVAMIYILFQLTDWRLALIGLLTFSYLGYAAAGIFDAPPEELRAAWPLQDHLLIFAIAVVTAFGLAISATSLRRERMRASLVTMGVLAHEMRTPLAGASLVAEYLRDPDLPNESRLAALDRLDNVVRSMHAIIDTQMSNARLMDLPREREIVDIGRLVLQAVEEFPLRAGPARELIPCDCPPGLMASVHPAMLRQVIHNLLTNAVKSIQAKGLKLRRADVSVSVLAVGERDLKIVVQDRGVGIAAEMLDKIFEPFQTSERMPAHGLGLAMCRATVLSFGGRLWCTSEPGQGSIFHIVIPQTSKPAS